MCAVTKFTITHVHSAQLRTSIFAKFLLHVSAFNDIHSSSKLQPTRFNVSWFICFYRRSTCFRPFLRPSLGAHNCTYSFRYFQLKW